MSKYNGATWMSVVLVLGLSACSGAGATPGQAPSAVGNVSQQPTTPADVPAEAKDFVAQYGSVYTDPVSTYYADRAYAKDAGMLSIFPPKDVAGYEFTDSLSAPVSVMGFSQSYLDMKAQTNTQTTVDLYNKYLIPYCINPYLNLVARNPYPESYAVIDNEFMKYCGAIETFTPKSSQDAYRAATQKLLDTLKTFVTPYGTTATFKFAKVTDQQNDSSFSIIRDQQINDLTNNVVKNFSNKIDLKIDIQQFHRESSDAKQEVVPVSIFVQRDHPTGTVDPGRVSIGWQ